MTTTPGVWGAGQRLHRSRRGAGEEEEDTDGGASFFRARSGRGTDLGRLPPTGTQQQYCGKPSERVHGDHSESFRIFGRPLATMLANDGAHVTRDVESILRVELGGRLSGANRPRSTWRAVCGGRPFWLRRCPSPVLPNRRGLDSAHSTVINVAREDNIDEVALLEANIEGLTYIPRSAR